MENEEADWWYPGDYSGDASYEDQPSEYDDQAFNDVEMFLTEHDQDVSVEAEVFPEAEVAEVLAATWKDKRQELSRLQKARKFHQAGELKRSFRVEVEELKKRTQCRRCGQTGHWARECKVRLPPRTPGTDLVSGASRPTSSAGLVQHFVCHAVVDVSRRPMKMLARLRELRLRRDQATPTESETEGCELLLVSSPGYAVLDSGCGRSVVGQETLAQFRRLWEQAKIPQPTEISEVNVFKFGNGAQETSHSVVEMPVSLAGRRGVIRAALIRGKAPLLLSRAALKTLKANMDFAKDELHIFEGDRRLPMHTNSAGQYVVPVANFSDGEKGEPNDPPEVESGVALAEPVVSEHGQQQSQVEDRWFFNEGGTELICEHGPGRSHFFTPKHEQCPLPVDQLSSVRTSVLRCASTGVEQCQSDLWTCAEKAHASIPAGNLLCETRFQVCSPPTPSESSQSSPDELCPVSLWNKRQARQVRSAARQAQVCMETKSKRERFDVIEVFSHPRFALEAITKGLSCVSADLLTGWDFRRAADRDAMRRLVGECPPELLVLCPPCTWAGGWYHLNKCYLSEDERRHRDVLTSLFLNFCADLAQLQLDAGGRVLFEHPKSSCVWKNPRWQKLASRMFSVEVDMCCYGLKVPDGTLIQKATRLLVSHADMQRLRRRCPGPAQPEHARHQPVQGSVPGVRSVSQLAGRYPPQFVRAVLRTVTGARARVEACLVQCKSDQECLVASRVAALDGQQKEQMLASLRQLHANLGHPTNSALVRVLKHGGASELAMSLARDFRCETCEAQRRPSPAGPANTHRVTEFNKRVGLDVKYLPGWQANQKIPALNVVDYGSSFQMMIPLPGPRETADSIRRAFQERWVTWAGRPEELVLDPAQVNLSEALTVPQELAGSIVSSTAAEAHWQLGKVEVHGGWFARVLEKVISDCAPRDKDSWMECVYGAHCKNELIQVYGMTPSQFVFGRNPRVPHNLLDEPLHVLPATAPLYEDSIARAVAIRQAARQAVIELQDSKALRLALAARPRVTHTFSPGTPVAYWRTQKSHEGKIEWGGRWHGPAIVLGYVGKNVVVIHKRQIFRCAPEQVRLATTEERSLMDTPNLELLGIKNLLQNNALESRQYVDLVPQPLPPESSVLGDAPMSGSPARDPLPSPAAPGPTTPPTIGPPVTVPEAGERSAASGYQERLSGAPSVEPFPATRVSEDKTAEEGPYGPVRRVSRKSAPSSQVFRPRAMLQDDFADMMQEVIPELLEQALANEVSTPPPLQEPSERGTKREASPHSEPAPSKRVSGSSTERGGADAAEGSAGQLAGSDSPVESLCIQLQNPEVCVEALVLNYVNRRNPKELLASGNEPALQERVDEAKTLEWQTVESRHAVRVVHGPEAARVRKCFPDRIMGSRFVITEKQEEDSPVRIKARWCLQGHLDPDLSEKARAGDLQSPTLSQVGRSLLFQLIASHKWSLRLGDIRGAFLSSGELPKKYRPLYATLPPGGIPGVPPDALVEVVGQVYGLNDSPAAWYRTLNQALIDVGFERSRFDPCIYYLRDGGSLVGIYGVHVDDSATGGKGQKYETAIAQLQKKFEFRKWRVLDGDFCGAHYSQDPQTFKITMSQDKFCEKLKPMHFSRGRTQNRDSPLRDDEVRCLRAINGSLNWLATQSRPDLSTQVSFSQQSFKSISLHSAPISLHSAPEN